jgi:hypothetical protein
MVGNSRMEGGGRDLLPSDDAKGWKNDVPWHVYAYIGESLLFVIQDLIGQSPNYSQQDYMGEARYAPFSVDEFNNVIAATYVKFVTNGDATREKPIVFHTTQKKRN